MGDARIICDYCEVEIIEYYHEGYRGNRGRCPDCGTDFPLE